MNRGNLSEREKIRRIVSRLNKIHRLARCSYVRDSENAKRIYNKLLEEYKAQYGLAFYSEIVKNLSEPFLIRGETLKKKSTKPLEITDNSNIFTELINTYISFFNPYNWLNDDHKPKSKVDKKS